MDINKKIVNKKKQDIILILIAYCFSVSFSFQFYRAYLEIKDIKNKQILIDKLLKVMIKNCKENFWFMPNNPNYKTILILITIGFTIWILVIITNNKKFMQGKEHGSSRWSTNSEKRRLADKKDENNIILTDDIKMSLDTRKTRKNLNVLVIGGSGSGKTRFYVKPNLMQLNSNFIVTDPKGDLFTETAKMFKDNNYKIKVLNLKDLNKSMRYNPLAYIKEEKDVFKLIKLIINNTNEGQKSSDPFWDKAETALLQSIIFYVLNELPKNEQNFNSVMKLLRCIQISEEDENLKSPLDIIFENLEKEKPNSIAIKQYKIFKSASGKTAKSILISTMSRLAFLDIKEISNIFMKDEIKIEELAEEKTVFYIIIPDTDTSLNFIVSILYSQMLDLLCNIADTKGLKYHIRFMLDEFANIGKIPDFEKILAVIRSREISANIILQSIFQLEQHYKKEYKSIIDNCDTTLFLGGQETAEWVSKKIGKMTIDSKVNNYTKGRNSSTSLNYSILGRELLTKEEVERLNDDECICFIRGLNPSESKKFKIEKHKMYKSLGDSKDFNNKNNFKFNYLYLENKKDIEEKLQIENNIKINIHNILENMIIEDISDNEEIQLNNSNNLKDELKNIFENLIIESEENINEN